MSFPREILIFMRFAFLCLMTLYSILWLAAVIDCGLAPISENWMLGTTVEGLKKWGAFSRHLFNKGEWWRMLTCSAQHMGFLHLATNLLGLYPLSEIYEPLLGSGLFIVLFLACCLGGTVFLGASMLQPGVASLEMLTVGCSGGVFGLIGLVLADTTLYSYRNPKEAAKLAYGTSFLTILSFILGILPIFDNFTHMGGFIVGYTLSLPTLFIKRRSMLTLDKEIEFTKEFKTAYTWRNRALASMGYILFLLFMSVCVSMLFTNKSIQKYIPEIIYVSCLPYKDWCEKLK